MLIILSALFHRNNIVRAIAALIFLVVAGSAWVAGKTGSARDLVGVLNVWDQVSAHASYAENVVYGAVFTLAALLIALIRIDSLRIAGLLLAAIGAIVTNVFVIQTGHLGGTLVYTRPRNPHDARGVPTAPADAAGPGPDARTGADARTGPSA